ncbi:hypothetical protein QOZ80_8BG0644680 [Eleusine coracana subsp. coracana]|nr:hypothetical protein QOZ80_8BG0644680 [Eleusine coracana subsp. coracana]
MFLSSAVQWWEKWQLRILVLGSFAAQCYLAAFGRARKSHIKPLSRLFIWLSYLASDGLAIYALATLFNRQEKLKYNYVNGRHGLEVLWTPILLMHLGGQKAISAYNIEDNELWRRQIVTAVSQVTVALYVFGRSWSSNDKRISAATILLFVPSIFRCFRKPLTLKRSSFNSLVGSTDPTPTTTVGDREQELEAYIQDAKTWIQENSPPRGLQDSNLQRAHKGRLHRPEYLDRLFVDFAHPYSERLADLKSFWLLSDESVHSSIEWGLTKIFRLLYTKDDRNRVGSRSYWLTQILTIVLAAVAFALVVEAAVELIVQSHGTSIKEEYYSLIDLIVTVILLLSTFLLEFHGYLSIDNFNMMLREGVVSQHNIVGFFVRNKNQTWLMSFARKLCKDLIDQYFCMEPSDSTMRIAIVVCEHIRDGWLNYISDAESYRKFNDTMGHWTLERYECHPRLGESLAKPFDESIILWHVATHFCFPHQRTPHDSQCAKLSREISNYMIHLLFANPEMLMPGSRKRVFKTAYKEIKKMMEGEKALTDEKEVTQRIIDKLKSGHGPKQGFIYNGWKLSQKLVHLGDEKMCKVIKGVWVEMLCFSAGRCRGYLHAKSIGSGGEYLSYIWILLMYAGMESFPERLQRRQHHLFQHQMGGKTTGRPFIDPQATDDEEENATIPSTSQVKKPLKNEVINAATQSAFQGKAIDHLEIEIVVP